MAYQHELTGGASMRTLWTARRANNAAARGLQPSCNKQSAVEFRVLFLLPSHLHLCGLNLQHIARPHRICKLEMKPVYQYSKQRGTLLKKGKGGAMCATPHSRGPDIKHCILSFFVRHKSPISRCVTARTHSSAACHGNDYLCMLESAEN